MRYRPAARGFPARPGIQYPTHYGTQLNTRAHRGGTVARMDVHEGVRRDPDDEPRNSTITLRVRPSTVTAIDALAQKEDRNRADMLRLIIQDGFRLRAQRVSTQELPED